MSNTGLVAKFIYALEFGDNRTVTESIAARATYRGPAARTADGTVKLGSVMSALIDVAPLRWHVLSVSEDNEGIVTLRRELRVAAGISHAVTASAEIEIHDGKIMRWVEHLEDPVHATLVPEPEFCANEADAAARIK